MSAAAIRDLAAVPGLQYLGNKSLDLKPWCVFK